MPPCGDAFDGDHPADLVDRVARHTFVAKPTEPAPAPLATATIWAGHCRSSRSVDEAGPHPAARSGRSRLTQGRACRRENTWAPGRPGPALTGASLRSSGRPRGRRAVPAGGRGGRGNPGHVQIRLLSRSEVPTVLAAERGSCGQSESRARREARARRARSASKASPPERQPQSVRPVPSGVAGA